MNIKIPNLLKCKWFSELVTNNNGKSAKSWFLVIVTLVGVFLLLVPGIALLVEVCHTHTITTDLTGWATYIGAVSTMFATVGATKVLGERNEQSRKEEHTDIEQFVEENGDAPKNRQRKFSL